VPAGVIAAKFNKRLHFTSIFNAPKNYGPHHSANNAEYQTSPSEPKHMSVFWSVNLTPVIFLPRQFCSWFRTSNVLSSRAAETTMNGIRTQNTIEVLISWNLILQGKRMPSSV
jgi:hypothetical protein